MHQPTVTVTNTMTDINLNMIQKSVPMLLSTYQTHILRMICICVCPLTVDGLHLQTLGAGGEWHLPAKYRLKCVIPSTKENIKNIMMIKSVG